MLCSVCRAGLEGIWDPSKARRVCRVADFDDDVAPVHDARFATVETYKTVKPLDPELRRPEHYMFGHHPTRRSFEQSVRAGCVMCCAFEPWPGGARGGARPQDRRARVLLAVQRRV